MHEMVTFYLDRGFVWKSSIAYAGDVPSGSSFYKWKIRANGGEKDFKKKKKKKKKLLAEYASGRSLSCWAVGPDQISWLGTPGVCVKF